MTFVPVPGNLIHRIVPKGSDYSAHSYQPGRGDVADYTKATLPGVYLERRGSRGFEALAYNSDDGLLYAFIQTPMDVNGERNGSTCVGSWPWIRSRAPLSTSSCSARSAPATRTGSVMPCRTRSVVPSW